MNKVLSILAVAFFMVITGCDPKPFVEHEISITQQAPDCEVVAATFRMVSNFGGERFEFSKCLPANFEKSQVAVSRQGDTVLVRFPVPPAEGRAVFAVTLDIDSYPRYNFITIDDETYSIVQSNN